MASKQQVRKYAAQAAFVFIGTVVKRKAATVPGIQTNDTAVVHIDHIVTAPAMFTALNGQQITVRLKDIAAIRKGSAMTFFTNGWIFGTSIAVDAIGHIADTGKQAMASMVHTSVTSHKNNILRARLNSAVMSVVGTVSKVQRSETRVIHISEHDPDWHEATIQIDEVLKGRKGTRQVSVLFPKSDDVRWHTTAKYTEGQKGIWIVQKGRKQDSRGIGPKVFAAIPSGKDVLTTLPPSDFLPLNELGRVKSLLAK